MSGQLAQVSHVRLDTAATPRRFGLTVAAGTLAAYLLQGLGAGVYYLAGVAQGDPWASAQLGAWTLLLTHVGWVTGIVAFGLLLRFLARLPWRTPLGAVFGPATGAALGYLACGALGMAAPAVGDLVRAFDGLSYAIALGLFHLGNAWVVWLIGTITLGLARHIGPDRVFGAR